MFAALVTKIRKEIAMTIDTRTLRPALITIAAFAMITPRARCPAVMVPALVTSPRPRSSQRPRRVIQNDVTISRRSSPRLARRW